MRITFQTVIGFVAGLATVELLREVAPLTRRYSVRVQAKTEEGLGAAKSPPNFDGARQVGRGREADRPTDIPIRGWKDIAQRTCKEFTEDQIPMIAAGVTFYTLLALFPGIGAFVALYGLFADIADAQKHVQAMSAILPSGAISLIGDQMMRVAAARDGSLSLAVVFGFLVALWSANGAMKAIITGLNIAYEETEKRSFIGKIAVPLAFTVGFLLFAIAAIALATVGAYVTEHWGKSAGWVFAAIYWPTLLIVFALGLTVLYRFGPSRRPVRWRWITWGSSLAALSWLAMSAGFSFYVANFGNYDKSYGAVGAVIGFMTWTWLSSMVLLLGAELNAEIEHQTARDTTVGSGKPIGARGAVMADTIGEAQS